MDQLKFLDGYKVYIVGAATVVFGLYQFHSGNVNGATTNILLGLGMLFGRHTLQKIEKKVS